MATREATSRVDDYFLIDELLSDDERLIRGTVRRFVDREVLPHIGGWGLRGEFPAHLIPPIAEMGLLGANLPPEYGAAGVSNIAYGLTRQELERGDSGLRSFASVQGALVMSPIYAFGTEEQRRRWLPQLARGEVIGWFGLTEPRAGPAPAAMQTRARRSSGGWELNGTKMWITNGSLAQVAIVWAKDEDGEIRGFIVETDRPGFSAHEIKTKSSMRASDTSELVLEGVRLPEDAALPEAVGLRGALMCLARAKRNTVPPALRIAREARSILGAYGITLEYHAMRHANNLESVDTYEGTYDIHTLIVGRDITGLDAF